ncbi:hypothetical protein [Parasitella parasitica]|uniref:Uncharacterized protein n=1 Tax=Parasitella parasitica TaxID=35722 RepID=A0A0B7NQD1_9FUNG|nr:hypothetical protein [Parasitella parasitica]
MEEVPTRKEPIEVQVVNDGTADEASVDIQVMRHRGLVKDLPKFKILNDDDTKDVSDAYVSAAQYFKAFERAFRMQNVNLKHNWRDNLSNVIGIDQADWKLRV